MATIRKKRSKLAEEYYMYLKYPGRVRKRIASVKSLIIGVFRDAQSEDAEELQAKLQALNRLIDSRVISILKPAGLWCWGPALAQQSLPQTPGISEDSDYTSDVSFPIHHQPNSSAHQWDSHLHPHRYRHHPKDTTLQASYEDEEDAYHARPDPYHEPAHHRYDSDYAVKTYDSEVPSHDYEYSTYDTEASTGRGVPSGNHKMSSYHGQQYGNAYRYVSNGYKDEEYYHEEEADHPDDAHFGRNPHYSERYESMEGTSDYRDEYRQQYPGDYWNEQEPLSYNSRPPQSMHIASPFADLFDPGMIPWKELNPPQKMSYRTASVDKTERRYDSDSSHRGGGYYGDDYDDRRTDSRAHNWRYDSIQEEDHVKEDWHDEKALRSWREEPVRDEDWHSEDQRTHDEEEHYAAEGYQADREDSSRQNSVERADGVTHQATDIAQ
ncbi:hypothetical protein ANCDUO_07919 [Ancylostoma duodenale]|uniref:Uncharacterized protein n=1 Tax=Ancylostoma duodenale TaxID=51022 RepID=A0A0C2CXR0_9BILA|nr:hypothetical protein ANCDUO_07919 [Ancylostoma duodenale]